jgi:hypothetical protein
MDWKYLLAIPSFVIGLLAGFQGIYERYDADPYKAARTLPGILYLLTRGVIPATVYLVLYDAHQLPNPLWFWSLVCGTAGTELILRAKFFIKEERSAEGVSRELMYGPLDLLRWYQNLFLKSIRGKLPTYRGEEIREYIRKILTDGMAFPDGMTFPEMCEKVKNNLYYYDSEPKIQQAIMRDVEKYQAEYEAKVKTEAKVETDEKRPELDIVFQYKLGYSIMRHVGERGLKLLLS